MINITSTITGVGFMKALNRQRAEEDGPVTYSNTNGRFVTVDICGTMGLWNTDMQLQKSVVVSYLIIMTFAAVFLILICLKPFCI